MKTAKLLNTESTYKLLQPFGTIEQLNANTRAIRQQYAKELPLATRQVLDVLHRYAAKYYGVCFLSKSKIAEMIGISKRTVIRACQRLESLGIVVQYELYRHNGDKRQSSNAIVFLTQISARATFVNDNGQESDNRQQSDVTPVCHSVEALSDTQNKKSLKDNTYATQAEPTKPLNLYQQIKIAVIKNGGTTEQVAEYARILYGSIKAAMKNDSKLSYRNMMKLAIESLYAALSTSINRIKTSRFALVSGIFKRKLAEIYETYSEREFALARGKRVEVIPQWFAEQRGIDYTNLNELKERKVFGRTEMIPEWFGKQNEHAEPAPSNDNIDYDAERARILAKLKRA